MTEKILYDSVAKLCSTMNYAIAGMKGEAHFSIKNTRGYTKEIDIYKGFGSEVKLMVYQLDETPYTMSEIAVLHNICALITKYWEEKADQTCR